MLDLKYVVENLETVRARTAQRKVEIDFGPLEQLAARRRELAGTYSKMRHEQLQSGEKMKGLDQKGPEAQALRANLKEMSNQLKAIDDERAEIEQKIQTLLLYVPNLTHASVPVGTGEADNVEVKRVGEPTKLAFEPKAHWDLGEALGILDFERGTKVTGTRFTFIKGAGARLERALINFMLDLHTREHGYDEMLPPFLVNRASLTGTGQLPKFEADVFRTAEDFFLIPTAEVPVTNYHRDEILEAAQLPIRYAAYSPCFRSEAGSYGKDTRGLIRQHQFNKVELVQFVHPDVSYEAHDKLVGHACTVLDRLELPYRVLSLCTADIGFAAARCYDLEVWLPGQNTYREISSCSNFEDYQARRANIRFRQERGAKPQFVHTLNGSGLAVGRTLLAILENYQQADGSVLVPKVLQPFMGTDRITAATR